MFALRGINVILVFLGIYLILGFLTIIVFSEEEEKWTIDKQRAFQKAVCMANCRNDVSLFYSLILY